MPTTPASWLVPPLRPLKLSLVARTLPKALGTCKPVEVLGWAAVKELNLRYYIGETTLITI